MSPGRSSPGLHGDGDIVFRTLAAPGLDEDDLYAAMDGLPGSGVLWGDGMPSAFTPAEEPRDADAERRHRHDQMLRKWNASDGWSTVR